MTHPLSTGLSTDCGNAEEVRCVPLAPGEGGGTENKGKLRFHKQSRWRKANETGPASEWGRAYRTPLLCRAYARLFHASASASARLPLALPSSVTTSSGESSKPSALPANSLSTQATNLTRLRLGCLLGAPTASPFSLSGAAQPVVITAIAIASLGITLPTTSNASYTSGCAVSSWNSSPSLTQYTCAVGRWKVSPLSFSNFVASTTG